MKNKISEAFGHINPSEQELSAILSKAVDKAERESKGKELRHRLQKMLMPKWYVPIGACLVLAIFFSVFGYPMISRAHEYTEALAFFRTNGISVAELTKEEVREVYRDITTGTFSKDKTFQVIKKNIKGMELEANPPNPEKLNALFEVYKHNYRNQEYKVFYNEEYDSNRDYLVLKSSSLIKSDSADEIIWEVEMPGFYVEDITVSDNRIMAYGSIPYFTDSTNTAYSVSVIDIDKGKALWTKQVSEYIVAALIDGSDYVVLAMKSGELSFYKFDDKGDKTLLSRTNLQGQGYIRQVIKSGSGYLASIYTGNNEIKLLRIGVDGSVEAVHEYNDFERVYVIADMAEYKGKVFLSTYSYTNLGQDSWEISDILDEIHSRPTLEISSGELVEMIRNKFEATLLVVDPLTGEPESFYSVPAAMGNNLLTDKNGKLIWEVGNPISAFYSPATSSFSISTTYEIYIYEFDLYGNFLSKTATDRTFEYRR